MPETYTPGRLARAKNLRDRDDVMWEIDKAVEAWEADLDDYARLHEDYLQQGNELATLRKRLEAAEKALVDDDEGVTEAHELLAMLRGRVRAALAAGEEPATCTWKQDSLDDLWETSCGQAWTFIDGGPEDNHVRFCHSCGRGVQSIPYREQP